MDQERKSGERREEPNPYAATDAAASSLGYYAQPSETLLSRGYVALLGTQFFGAANDNVLKQCLIFMVATGIWSGSVAEGGLGKGGQVVPALLLTVPFIFLSGYAGQISDRFSKQKVMVWVKIAEVPIALVAFAGFFFGNLWLTLFSLLLLSVQSSFFGPAKYGVIPELLADRHLSMANGLINMFTNLAVIGGSLAAGPLSDKFNPEAMGNTSSASVPWAPGAALLVIAVCGLLASLALPRLAPADPKLKFDWNPFGAYFESVRLMAKGPLLAVVIAWAGFYMIAMMALTILPEYQGILGVSFTKTSYLLGFLGIAVAIGSVITGWISGDHVKPWLIPCGALGMTVAFGVLGLLPGKPTYLSVAACIFAVGFSAGFYIVPLQALIQLLSPDDERGRIIGTSGAISFCFSSLGPLIFYGAVQSGMPPNRVFLICAGLAFVGTVVGALKLREITSKPAQDL